MIKRFRLRFKLIQDPKVDYVDLGGAYVGPGQNRVLRLIDEFGLQTYKIHIKDNCLRYYDVIMMIKFKLN